MVEINGNDKVYLTNRDLILEIREDVRVLRDGFVRAEAILSTAEKDNVRLDALEAMNLRVKGAWAAVSILVAVATGVSGLAIGLAGLN
jgi:hypothetical protein